MVKLTVVLISTETVEFSSPVLFSVVLTLAVLLITSEPFTLTFKVRVTVSSTLRFPIVQTPVLLS